MSFSVIIPAYNEEDHIVQCLRSLGSQTVTGFEVIVVDNGSTDDTSLRARFFQSHSNNAPFHLRVLRMKRGTIAAARNYGTSVATGYILAFLDADCRPGTDWVADAVYRSRLNEVWGAHYRIPDGSTWVARVWAKYQATERDGLVDFLPGCCIIMHRQDFMRLGGFNESVETSEDVELCNRAIAQGMQVWAYPALAVVHEGTPQSLQHFYRQSRWHGWHVARNFLANLPSTKNAGVVALSAYTLVMFWLSIIVCALGPWPIAAITVALFFLPPALLAARKAKLADVPRLFVLYMVYALARAAALTHITKGRKGEVWRQS